MMLGGSPGSGRLPASFRRKTFGDGLGGRLLSFASTSNVEELQALKDVIDAFGFVVARSAYANVSLC